MSWQVILTFTGVIATKIVIFCAGSFGSQQDLSSKLWLVCLMQGPYTESPCPLMPGQLLQTACPSLFCLIWLFSSSLSLSPAFLPSSHAGRCCSLRLPTGILISAPRQRSVPPCSLRPQSPVFPQEHSYPPVTDLQFFLLHAWFSHPGSLQRKHWQEKSAKVRTNRSFFLLCIFGNRLFRKVTYACQGKCVESLPTWSQLPSFSRQSCGSEYASRSLSSGSAAITWESDFILPCSKSWAPVTMGKKPRRWPSWTQAPRQPPKARRTEAPLQTRGSEGAGR